MKKDRLTKIKELVENSIDAGATKIEISVSNECRNLRIADNGCGIHPDDILLAFSKHATSKIETDEDLFNIATLGFRGEALSSIISIAKVTCTTRPKEFDYGTKVECENSNVKQAKTGCAVGTIMNVENLFYNIPARLKFLKSSKTEFAYIQELMQNLALINPNIAFDVKNDGKVMQSVAWNKGNNLEIEKNYLELALNNVGRAATGKAVRPILNGTKIEVNNHGLFLTASDSRISIVTKIPLEDSNGNTIITMFEPGIAVINARSITDVVRKLSGTKIEIETIEENILKIRDEVSDFSLNCMDANEYPLIDLNISGIEFNLETKQFINCVDYSSYAASEKNAKPVYEGVNICSNDNKLVFSATDGVRIAIKTLECSNIAPFSVTIPSKLIEDVARIAEGDSNVTITICEKKVSFKFKNTLVIVGIINGSYPNVLKVIPQTFESSLIVNASKLVESLDRTSILSSDRNNIVRFSLSNNSFKVHSRSQEVGSVSDVINNFTYEGNNLEISFTARYVIEILKLFGNEEVKFMFNENLKPVVIKSISSEEALGLILPTKTY